MKLRYCVSVFVVGLLFFNTSVLAFGPVEFEVDEQPGPLNDVQIEQKLDNQLPLDAVFVDENGRSKELGDFIVDKPVVLALVYYECPMLCNLVLNGLLRTLRAVTLDAGKDFNVVAVSFDPGESSDLAKAKKENYVAQYKREGSSSGWNFLTGTEENIKRVTDAVGFKYVYEEETDEYAHGSAIMVLTPEGKLARYFFGIEYPARDLRLSLVEASKGKIGTFVDQVLLYCFHYDPSSGKYSLMIMNILKIAGVITVLMLGIFIVVSMKRDKQ